MKKLVMAVCILTLSFNCPITAEKTSKPHQCEPIIDEDGAEVLSNFAGIIGNFIGIVQAPHNPANVGANLAGMVHGMANMLAIATRSGKNLEEYVQTPEFQEQFAQVLTKRMHCSEIDADQPTK